MNRKCILLLFSVCLITAWMQAQNQQWQWATAPSNSANSWGSTIAVANNGNIITGGSFTNDHITFGDVTISDPQEGSKLFLVCHDNAGNLLWAKGSTTSTIFAGIVSIDTDDENFIYVAGNFRGSLTLDGISLSNGDLTTSFMLKLDAYGNVVWLKQISPLSYISQIDVINGFVYAVGNFSANIDFFGQQLVNNGAADTFASKFTKDGELIWVDSFGGSDLDYGSRVVVDSQNNIYLAGRYYSPALTFGGITINNLGGSDIFLLKFSNTGQQLWIKSYGDIHYESCEALSIDSSDAIYASYNFSNNLTIADNTFTALGGDDNIIVKYNTLGDEVWSQQWGGALDDYITGIRNGGGNSTYITGYSYSSTTGLSVDGTDYSFGDEMSALFIAMIGQDGDLQWIEYAAGPEETQSHAICVDSQDIYITGNASEITLGDFPVNENGSYEMFIAKLSLEALGTSDLNIMKGIVYPNPAKNVLNIDIDTFLGQPYTIADMTGRTVKSGIIESTVDVSTLPSGIYALGINGITSKFVKE